MCCDTILIICCRPSTAKELFNLRHASLRNVIERIFGVSKRRFRLMSCSPEYDADTQSKIPAALAVLHNFIRIHDPDDDNDDDNDEHDSGTLSSQQTTPTYTLSQESLGGYIDRAERNRAGTRRDEIAERMWVDYVRELHDRGEI